MHIKICKIIRKRGIEMKRYRICYDKMLVAKGDLNINGELYGGVSAYLEYQIFNKTTGEEIFFTYEDTDTPREEKIEGHYLNDYYDLADDNVNGFIIIPADELKELKDHDVKFRVGMFTKSIEINGCLEDISITEEQFVKILKDNPQSFDTADNNYAQNCGVTFNIIGR
jgi:hypothetical protein